MTPEETARAEALAAPEAVAERLKDYKRITAGRYEHTYTDHAGVVRCQTCWQPVKAISTENTAALYAVTVAALRYLEYRLTGIGNMSRDEPVHLARQIQAVLTAIDIDTSLREGR